MSFSKRAFEELEQCEHRYEITFCFTVVGFGDNESDAIQEARRFAFLIAVEDYEVSNIEKDLDSEPCNDCLEKIEKRGNQ
tara:strand:- start:87 stop:326 length:240 start_codon:yes stop_codon:yes gene_type:complete